MYVVLACFRQTTEDWAKLQVREVVDAAALLKDVSLSSLLEAINSLESCRFAISPHRFESTKLSAFMIAMVNLRVQSTACDVWGNLFRARIMLQNHQLLETIRKIEGDLCPEFFASASSELWQTHWVAALLRSVHSAL
jgi:hypothetical protein